MKMIASTKMLKAQKAMGSAKSYGDANAGEHHFNYRRIGLFMYFG
jgi:hypothetical protein